jgi:hypothetical protein
MAKTSKKRTIPDALKNFDSLPDSAHVRVPVVKGLFGCSDATVWRMVDRGRLKPRKLSERVTGFNVGDLRLALQGEEEATIGPNELGVKVNTTGKSQGLPPTCVKAPLTGGL